MWHGVLVEFNLGNPKNSDYIHHRYHTARTEIRSRDQIGGISRNLGLNGEPSKNVSFQVSLSYVKDIFIMEVGNTVTVSSV